MSKRHIAAVLTAVLAGVGAAGTAVVPSYAGAYDSSCWAAQLTDPKVHTTALSGRGIDDLGADVAGYTAVHWRVHRPDGPSLHASPKSCDYQIVLQLRPEHARRLAAQMAGWAERRLRVVDPDRARMFAAYRMSGAAYVRKIGWTYPPNVWSELQPFVAADARWIYQPGHNHAHRGSRTRMMHLDPEHSTAVITFSTD